MMFPPEQSRHDRIHCEWIESEFGIPEVSRQQLLHLNIPLTFLSLQLSTVHPLNQPVDVQARKNKNKPTGKVDIDCVVAAVSVVSRSADASLSEMDSFTAEGKSQ